MFNITRRLGASQAERYAWGSLIITGVVIVFLQSRFLEGWNVSQLSGPQMAWTYGIAVLLTIVGESVLAGTLASQSKSQDIEKDERDLAIEARAEIHSHWFMVIVVNIIVVQLLMQSTYEGGTLVPSLNVGSTEGIVFALVMLLYGVHAVKMVSTIVGYRS